MESVRAQLLAMGVDTAKLDNAQVKDIARALKVPVPREIEILEYKGAQYVKTDGYPVPARDGSGKITLARNLFVRVEALDDAIQDLITAKGLLAKK